MTGTRKQKDARERNWMILRLRGAYAVMCDVGNKHGQDAIEHELEKLGAKTHKHQREEFTKEILSYGLVTS